MRFDKKYQIEKCCSTDEFRPAITGVYVGDGFLAATDATVLVKVPCTMDEGDRHYVSQEDIDAIYKSAMEEAPTPENTAFREIVEDFRSAMIFGKQVWRKVLIDGEIIETFGEPAVDPDTGEVMLGEDNGYMVYTVDANRRRLEDLSYEEFCVGTWRYKLLREMAEEKWGTLPPKASNTIIPARFIAKARSATPKKIGEVDITMQGKTIQTAPYYDDQLSAKVIEETYPPFEEVMDKTLTSESAGYISFEADKLARICQAMGTTRILFRVPLSPAEPIVVRPVDDNNNAIAILMPMASGLARIKKITLEAKVESTEKEAVEEPAEEMEVSEVE